MKKQIKTIILFITIFSLYFGFRVWAAADPDTYTFELSSEGTGEIDRAGGAGFYGKIVSATPQGNYTLLIDDCGSEGLVNTSQWNEYQLMIQQGNPEVVLVDIGWSEGGYGEHFYVISSYQLAGQPEVKLPKESQIKIKDPFNCDHLSILKYLGNQLGSSYVFNQTKREQEIKDNNAKIAAEYAKERAKWAEMDKQAEQQVQINAEKDINNKAYGSYVNNLPYTYEYINNYIIEAFDKSNDKVQASFDNERNYIQQWLDKNGFKTLEEVYEKISMNEDLWNIEYSDEGWKKYRDTKAKYSAISTIARGYLNLIKKGELPKNATYGDYIRWLLKNNLAINSSQISAIFKDYNIDWVPLSQNVYTSTSNRRNITGVMAFRDVFEANTEIYNMILKNLPTIAQLKTLTNEEKISMVERFTHFIDVFWSAESAREIIPEYISGTEYTEKIMNKWITEYLTEADKEEMRKKGKDYWTEQQWKYLN